MNLSSDDLTSIGKLYDPKVLAAMPRRLRTMVADREREEAFNRCLTAGILGSLIDPESKKVKSVTNVWTEVIDRFFRKDDVAAEIASISAGRGWDKQEWRLLFSASIEANDGDAVRIGSAPRADLFEQTFFHRLVDEPAVADLANAVEAPRRVGNRYPSSEIAAFLEGTQASSAGIEGNQLTAKNIVSGRHNKP